MKLHTLKRKISRTANLRGHRLSWGGVFGRSNGPQGVICRCLKCGKEGLAMESPAPNQINMSGEVLALNCN
jgi:hypothetical protein